MNPAHDLLIPVSSKRQLIRRRVHAERRLARLIQTRSLPIHASQLGGSQCAELLDLEPDFREELGIFEGVEWVETGFGLIAWEEE